MKSPQRDSAARKQLSFTPPSATPSPRPLLLRLLLLLLLPLFLSSLSLIPDSPASGHTRLMSVCVRAHAYVHAAHARATTAHTHTCTLACTRISARLIGREPKCAHARMSLLVRMPTDYATQMQERGGTQTRSQLRPGQCITPHAHPLSELTLEGGVKKIKEEEEEEEEEKRTG